MLLQVLALFQQHGQRLLLHQYQRRHHLLRSLISDPYLSLQYSLVSLNDSLSANICYQPYLHTNLLISLHTGPLAPPLPPWLPQFTTLLAYLNHHHMSNVFSFTIQKPSTQLTILYSFNSCCNYPYHLISCCGYLTFYLVDLKLFLHAGTPLAGYQ